MGDRVLKQVDELYPIIKDDLEEIHNLNKCFGGWVMPDPEAVLRERLSSDEIIIKRDDKGQVEGFIVYFDFGDRLEIQNLAIRQGLRKTLYGSKLATGLVEDCFKLANGRPVYSWFLKVESKIIEYAIRMGFECVSENYYQYLMRRDTNEFRNN